MNLLCPTTKPTFQLDKARVESQSWRTRQQVEYSSWNAVQNVWWSLVLDWASK